VNAVVTGCGWLGSAGMGMSALVDALRTGPHGIVETQSTRYPHRARGPQVSAPLATDVPMDEWVSRREARRMSPLSRMAVVAARMAMADAGLDRDSGGTLSTVVATVFGASNFTEEILRTIQDPEAGPRFVTPFHFTDCVANAPAGQVAVAVGARGPNTTVCQREAGNAIALRRGGRDLATGRAERCLVGAVDEAGELMHAILRGFRAVTAGVARPFDRRRNGALLAEGAGFCLLEREAGARARGARIQARVVSSGQGFDPTATPASWGSDVEGLAAGLATVLDRAGGRETIDAVVAGASGSRRGDLLEAAVLRRVFGDALPPVVCPKAQVGEYGGGALLPALGVLRGGEGATAGVPVAFEPDPAVGVTPHPRETALAPGRVLWSSLATSGAAAWVVLERAED